MGAPSTSVFITRIKGLSVVDSSGDPMGVVHDVVVQIRNRTRPPRVKGIVMALFARRRVYVPMERVYAIDSRQLVISGSVNARRFRRREGESLVIEDLIDRQIICRGQTEPSRIYDISMAPGRAGDWEINQVALSPLPKSRFANRLNLTIVRWSEVPDLSPESQTLSHSQIADLIDLHPADVARHLHDMEPSRRLEVVQALDDHQLAEALEELPDDEQVALISILDPERAADILEEMDPDDAADLVADLPDDQAEILLTRMQPKDAQDVRDLLLYDEETAGGMMTPEPVILPPDDTVADALARVRDEDLPPALAAMVFVVRPPLDTPTGTFLGAVHIQRLLREPPSAMVSSLIDTELEPLDAQTPLALVSRYFATYDMVVAPVVDSQSRLVGAVTVDDVLDHMLPEDWRGIQLDAATPGSAPPDDQQTVAAAVN
ncbi:MAG: CBS domain-containing protein [Propionibacteriaceae bacterium]|jgi:flagellar motility protein MotE (MotC chaperone)/sporulation protein YlmC with PRC-barrel domain|nr:CBS domain-containing protein [Propionibacteriaceae bacterium]